MGENGEAWIERFIGIEGGRMRRHVVGSRAMWQSAIYNGSLSLRESPGANGSVKYSEKDQEQKHRLSVT